MRFFKRKHKDAPNKVSDKAAGWIASGILKTQSCWARCMEKLFSNLSPLSTKVVFVIAFLFMTGYCTMLITFSFDKADRILLKPVIGIQSTVIGRTTPDLPSGAPAFIKRIERFKHYLDSLSKTDDGRRKRDSLLYKRPGLLDSIRNIESIYCEK